MELIGRQLGYYLLQTPLGRGNYAQVYQGEHIRLKTKVAIKVLKTEEQLNEQQRETFLKEAQTIARLRHPNIIRILNFGIERKLDNTPYLVMTLASHGSLRDRHQGGTQVPLETVVSYVRKIAEALQYAHDQSDESIIHCDIKPENMLLNERDDILLSDFGIAVTRPKTGTFPSTIEPTPSTIFGTVGYMAPERFHGKIEKASDQYALAVVAYEWLTGQLPFTGSLEQIMHKHLTTTPPPMRDARPNLSPDVESVILKGLTKDFRDRYLSILEFAQALERAAYPLDGKNDHTDSDVYISFTDNSIPLQTNIPAKDETAPQDKGIFTLQAESNPESGNAQEDLPTEPDTTSDKQAENVERRFSSSQQAQSENTPSLEDDVDTSENAQNHSENADNTASDSYDSSKNDAQDSSTHARNSSRNYTQNSFMNPRNSSRNYTQDTSAHSHGFTRDYTQDSSTHARNSSRDNFQDSSQKSWQTFENDHTTSYTYTGPNKQPQNPHTTQTLKASPSSQNTLRMNDNFATLPAFRHFRLWNYIAIVTSVALLVCIFPHLWYLAILPIIPLWYAFRYLLRLVEPGMARLAGIVVSLGYGSITWILVNTIHIPSLQQWLPPAWFLAPLAVIISLSVNERYIRNRLHV